MRKDKVEALVVKMGCEGYECGKYGKVKHQYRVSYCKEAKEYVAQRFEKRFKETKIEFEKKLKKQKDEILIANQKIMERIIRESKQK